MAAGSMAKDLSSASDPLIVSENRVEDGYLKNRKFWVPFDSQGSLFTDPKSHVKDKYLYLVHAPSRISFEHPDSLKDLLISVSLINKNHNKTFGGTDHGVFILKVPKNLIFATSPVDIGLDNGAIFPVSLEGTGLKPGMSFAEIKARLIELQASNPDGKEVSDQAVADTASILKYGNRLRIELRDKFKKHGIHHPDKVMEKAAIRRLGPHSWSNGHTEIVVLGKNESEAVKVAGVLFFKTTPATEKSRFLDFASKYSLPAVELDQLVMNPLIDQMPSIGETVSVQGIPIDWEGD
jgi:hypothetical protein